MPSQTPDDAGNAPEAAAISPAHNRDPIPHDLYCLDCGYNLRGLISDRCPECGRSLGAMRSTVSQIPWAHRRTLGLLNAYWGTVWIVMFRQKRLCEEMARPVDYADAQRFRWATILHVWIPVSLGMISGYAQAWMTLLSWWLPAGFRSWLLGATSTTVWPAAMLLVCFLLFLAAITGIPSYFFHPKDMAVELQNRAIALSYYTCGPLALAALPVGVLAASIGVKVDAALGARSLILPIVFVGGQMLAWWFSTVNLAHRIMPHRGARKFAIAVCVPPLWGLLGGLILAGLPAVLLYAMLVFAYGG